MANHFIVMGDIVGSRGYQSDKLMKDFKTLIFQCNSALEKGILSPYTITLGDEFQGVARSLYWSVQSLLFLEESSLQKNLEFELRYVVHYGTIETPINRNIAHAMIGPGLAQARELLTTKSRRQPRFLFDLPHRDFLGIQLGRLFGVMGSLSRDWKGKETDLLFEMLWNDNNALIGERYNKNRSQIGKLRKNRRVNEYRALRDAVIELSQWDMRR